MHLTHDQMRRWHDAGEGDRDAIVEHLAACDACGAGYAEIVRAATPEPAAAFDEAAFREAGYRAGPQPPNARAARAWWPALAAAAALVLVAGTYVAYLAPELEPVTRSDQAGVRPVRPSGSIARADLEFVWEGPRGAYRLRVFDLTAPEAPVMARDDVESGYRPTEDERRALRAGVEYRWFVERPGGDALSSPAARFTVR